MNQADALRRLEVLEAQARRASLAVDVEAIAAASGIHPGDLVAEAERLSEIMAWGGMPAVLDQLSRETGVPVDLLMAQADAILFGVSE